MIIWIYGLLLLATGVYSYFLIDPNITFFQNSYWVQFRDWAVYLGYYRRDISWLVYLILLILLFAFHFIFLRKHKQYSAVTIAGLIVLLGCVSYPFVTHDIFNYLFDARILTHYGLNPYTHTALDFQKDLWTRFMHWTHRSYPYGPTFLPLTLIPSFLGFGKFSLTFFLYKVMNGGLYFLAVYLLNKKHRREALLFATHPLIIIEGLINGHNDMIAVSLALIGLYLLEKKYSIWSRALFLLSAGIKYVTSPIALLGILPAFPNRLTNFAKKYEHQLLFCLQALIIIYMCIKLEIQPWYFLPLFIFVPFFPKILERSSILFFGLLVSYYPFIRLGAWSESKVELKHQIFFATLIIQCGYWILIYLRKKKFIIK